MDVCHLLLGRPWHYDEEVVHYGKENKYSFKKDEVTYKISLEDRVEKSTAKALLMSGKEFLKDLKEGEGVGYAIMLKPKKEETYSFTPIPIEVQELLDQFKDIIYDGDHQSYYLRGP